jgi:hypothetical protein
MAFRTFVSHVSSFMRSWFVLSAPGATGVDGKQEEKKDDAAAAAPAVDATGVPAAPDLSSSIPIPPPMDIPQAPPMMAGADGMVVGAGAPPPPPPPDF